MKREEQLKDLLNEIKLDNDVEVMKDGNDEDGDSGNHCPQRENNG